jgi:hypothetical protein
VSAALAPLTTHDVVHVNAEFFDGASDHDPLLERIHVALPVPPALPTARDVLAFFDTAVAAGDLRGLRNGRLEVFLFRLDLSLAVLAEHRGHMRAAEALLRVALQFADGDPKPKDTLEGPALADLADMLRASLERF